MTGPEPSAPAALPKRPVQPVPSASPAPDPASQPVRTMAGPLELSFEARHFSQAMVNASIAYRLLLSNLGDTPLGPLRVAADLTSAHGSLSVDQLLDPDSPDLKPVHELPGLAPGETRELKGELRLPLAAILPVHQGTARLFVPLVRLRMGGDAIDIIRVFVVGQSSGQPDGPLKPFPLDRGPGMIRDIGQREVSPST